MKIADNNDAIYKKGIYCGIVKIVYFDQDFSGVYIYTT